MEQKQKVFETLKTLSQQGFTIILVSHKIEEILEICSKATVMQRGKILESIDLPTEPKNLINLMFGHQNIKYDTYSNKSEVCQSPKILLNISDFNKEYSTSLPDSTQSIRVPQNIILGVAGLQGSGADKFIQNFQITSNNISLETNPHITKLNTTYVPADRLEKGLFPDMTIKEHVALTYNRKKTIDWEEMRELTELLIEKFGIIGNPNSIARTLSGGNQQRLMLSLITESTELLLLEQPTRGLDIQSSNYIWDTLLKTKKMKTLTMFSSTDIDEIYEYSEYIICFFNNKIVDHGYPKYLTRDVTMQKISGN